MNKKAAIANTLQPDHQPLYVAHRGAQTEAPENTAPAFRLALSQGVDGIEFDLQLSKDEVVVLHHDRTLQRIAGHKRRVSDLSYDELLQMDIGSHAGQQFRGERILRFDEVLAQLAGKTRLFVEIKSRRIDRLYGISTPLTKKVLGLIRQYVGDNFLPGVHIISFDRRVLETARQIEPDWKYILNHHDPAPTGPRARENFEGLWGHGIQIAKLTEAWVQHAHAHDQFIMTWTCNGPRQLAKAHRLGADIILTDRPGWLLNVTGNRG